MLDYAIIGAGPAGLQVAYLLNRAGLTNRIFEGNNSVGSFFRKQPRHRKLISINKRFTGRDDAEYKLRHDWNSLLADTGTRFTEYDQRLFPKADSLIRYLEDFQKRHNIDVALGHQVTCIAREGDVFQLTFANSEPTRARRVIVTTGVSRPVIPDIPGIELAEQYTEINTDPSVYEGQRVFIIGKGNSAFETADAMVDTAALIHLCSPESIKMAWNTHYVGNLRAVNNSLLDMYQLKSQHAALDANILAIRKAPGGGIEVCVRYLHAENEVETLHYDRAICCAGFAMDTTIFDSSCRPSLTDCGRYPALEPDFQAIGQPSLYFAGALTQALDHKRAASGFIHGFRYNADALVNILSSRDLNIPLRHEWVAGSADALVTHVLARVNRVSSLWQQQGYLADFYVPDAGGKMRRYDSLPLQYGLSGVLASARLVTLTLEFGSANTGDVFAQQRIARDNYNAAAASKFLHPVLRCWEDGQVVAEHHVIEDLEAVWTETEHGAGIKTFFREVFPNLSDARFDDSQVSSPQKASNTPCTQ